MDDGSVEVALAVADFMGIEIEPDDRLDGVLAGFDLRERTGKAIGRGIDSEWRARLPVFHIDGEKRLRPEPVGTETRLGPRTGRREHDINPSLDRAFARSTCTRDLESECAAGSGRFLDVTRLWPADVCSRRPLPTGRQARMEERRGAMTVRPINAQRNLIKYHPLYVVSKQEYASLLILSAASLEQLGNGQRGVIVCERLDRERHDRT